MWLQDLLPPLSYKEMIFAGKLKSNSFTSCSWSFFFPPQKILHNSHATNAPKNNKNKKHIWTERWNEHFWSLPAEQKLNIFMGIGCLFQNHWFLASSVGHHKASFCCSRQLEQHTQLQLTHQLCCCLFSLPDHSSDYKWSRDTKQPLLSQLKVPCQASNSHSCSWILIQGSQQQSFAREHPLEIQ